MDLDEILYGVDEIEYCLNNILFNPIPSTIQKWWTFKLLRWVLLSNRLGDLDEILYEINNIEGDLDSILLNPYIQPFQNGGRLNFCGGFNFEPTGGSG